MDLGRPNLDLLVTGPTYSDSERNSWLLASFLYFPLVFDTTEGIQKEDFQLPPPRAPKVGLPVTVHGLRRRSLSPAAGARRGRLGGVFNLKVICRRRVLCDKGAGPRLRLSPNFIFPYIIHFNFP